MKAFVSRKSQSKEQHMIYYSTHDMISRVMARLVEGLAFQIERLCSIYHVIFVGRKYVW